MKYCKKCLNVILERLNFVLLPYITDKTVCSECLSICIPPIPLGGVKS